MSKALKCDRCGTCFVPEEIDGITIRFINPRFYTKEDFQGYSKTSKSFFGQMAIDDFVDLCPNCSMMFSGFMLNVKDSQNLQTPL